MCACLQPCALYENSKNPRQQLFAAAAALHILTGDAHYRLDADSWFDSGANLFYSNWNNVWPQGLSILAGTADVPGVQRTQHDYIELLGKHVSQWAECSNSGSSGSMCKCASLPL
jgi:hypothetical protein